MGNSFAHLPVPVEARLWPTARPGRSRRGPLADLGTWGRRRGERGGMPRVGCDGCRGLGSGPAFPDPAAAVAKIQERLDEVQR